MESVTKYIIEGINLVHNTMDVVYLAHDCYILSTNILEVMYIFNISCAATATVLQLQIFQANYVSTYECCFKSSANFKEKHMV